MPTLMKEHVNFYENLQEARMRLEGTVVLYEDEPYILLTITDHMSDGIFRVYLDPLKKPVSHVKQVPYGWYDEPGMSRGQAMDKFLADNPGCGILRKHMNSPAFNRFRPFPIGMVNSHLANDMIYIERGPTRQTFQGLTEAMLKGNIISIGPRRVAPDYRVRFRDGGLYAAIKNDYPDLMTAIAITTEPSISNTACAFHREFGVVSGPVGSLFLVHKTDVVGFIPNNDNTLLYLDKQFEYLKEKINELQAFMNVVIR